MSRTWFDPTFIMSDILTSVVVSLVFASNNIWEFILLASADIAHIVNRIRVSTANAVIIGTWSRFLKVFIYDILYSLLDIIITRVRSELLIQGGDGNYDMSLQPASSFYRYRCSFALQYECQSFITIMIFKKQSLTLNCCVLKMQWITLYCRRIWHIAVWFGITVLFISYV